MVGEYYSVGRLARSVGNLAPTLGISPVGGPGGVLCLLPLARSDPTALVVSCVWSSRVPSWVRMVQEGGVHAWVVCSGGWISSARCGVCACVQRNPPSVRLV